jgi:hypothetical protein
MSLGSKPVPDWRARSNEKGLGRGALREIAAAALVIVFQNKVGEKNVWPTPGDDERNEQGVHPMYVGRVVVMKLAQIQLERATSSSLEYLSSSQDLRSPLEG